MPVLPYDAKTLEWRHSFGTNNLCGFDSIAQALQTLIDAGLLTEDYNRFCNIYLKTRSEVSEENVRLQYARALKRLFAKWMLTDKSERDTPFDIVFGADVIQYVKNQDSIYDDRAIKASIVANQADYDAQYAAFRLADPLHEEDGISFYNYLKVHAAYLINFAKAKFSLLIATSCYEARDIDLIYIARQFGCFGNVVVHNIIHGSPMPAISENELFDDMALDLHLRNTGGHWEGAKLAPVAALRADKPVPPKPILTRAEIVAKLLSPAVGTQLIFSGRVYQVKNELPGSLIDMIVAAPALVKADGEAEVSKHLAQALREVSKGPGVSTQLRIAFRIT